MYLSELVDILSKIENKSFLQCFVFVDESGAIHEFSVDVLDDRVDFNIQIDKPY